MNLQVRKRRGRVDVLPMIDVMFFMLVFFMLFMTFKQAQTGVEVDLPKAMHMGQDKQNTVVISIDKEQKVYYGKKGIQLNELAQVVKDEARKDATVRFVIRPDAAVAYQDIVRVMDILAAAGVDKPLWGVDRNQIPKKVPEEPQKN